MKKIVLLIIVSLNFINAQVPAPHKSGAWIGSFITDPSNHVEGWILYNQTEKKIKYSNGVSWIALGDGNFPSLNEVLGIGNTASTSIVSSADMTAVNFLGESLVLSKSLNQDGLKFDVSESNNGTYDVLLNANNEANSGLNFGLGSGNYNVTFWDYLDNKRLQITAFSLLAPSLTLSQQTNARSLVTLEKVQDLISNGNFNVASNYQISGNWIFNEPIEVPDPTLEDEAVNLRYFEANTLSNVLPFYDLDADTYTITEEQIENLTTIYVNANQTDVTITIPSTSLTGQNFINIQHLGSGTVTVIPATGVNLQQYVSTSAKSFILASITANTWFLRDGDVTVSTYTPPPPPLNTNIVLNSTFDDATNLSFQDWRWTVATGTLNYNDSSGATTSFTLSEPLIDGVIYTISFDIISGVARLNLGSGNTDYFVGTSTYSYTHSGVDSLTFPLTADNGASGTAFELDNFTIIQD